MAYRYRSRRSAKKLVRKSRQNLIITLILVGLLAYATLNWILPYFINGIGLIKDTVRPSEKIVRTSKNPAIAPPVLNIPFEATNSSEINIRGFGNPGSKVKIFLDDQEKAEVKVSEDGSFATENITLNLGINNIYGKTIDEKGNESLASKTLRLSYIFEKPGLTVDTPGDNKTIQGGDKKVQVSGKTDPGVKVFINESQVIVDKDGGFKSELLINDGDNTITIKALDVAGNFTELQRRVIYLP